MRLYKRGASLSLFLLVGVSPAGLGTTGGITGGANGVALAASANVPQANAAKVQFVTAEELKAKLAKNEAVAIIDVRGSTGVLENDNKIKGAVYVKLRRLKTRLSIPPLQ